MIIQRRRSIHIVSITTALRTAFLMTAALFYSTAHASLPDFTDLVEDASPSVVNISTVTHTSQPAELAKRYNIPQEVPEIFQHFFDQFKEFGQGLGQGLGQGQNGQLPFGFDIPKYETSSLGSGFIISSDGYILTNNHVVQGADEIIVSLSDRRELPAQLIGADKRSDLALLKVDAKGLPEVDLGSSDDLKVGEWVLAIGSPFGFDYSVTAGIVSAKGRSLPNENYVPFIQTDVAINPGNSGGPLFNLDGEVVGINSQIYTRSGGFMGVSFAIPINVAVDVAEQLKAQGKVDRGWLGIMIQEVNKDLAESFGLKKARGALVAQLVPGGPAEKGGLLSGDIITEFNGQEINMSSDLPHFVGRIKPDSTVKLDIVRNGKSKVIKIKIGALPDENEYAQNTVPKSVEKVNRLGVVVAELTTQQKASWGDGVMVQRVNRDQAGENAGIMTGDIISLIYGQSIHSISDFNRVVESLPYGRSVPVQIVRKDRVMFIPLRLSDK